MSTQSPPSLRSQEMGQRLLLAFEGKDHLPEAVRQAMRRYRPSGFTLFRAFNVDSPAQVQQLTHELQAAAHAEDLPRLLIALDQEGGQLMAISAGMTQLPGNLALGAAASTDLARQAGQVLGRELAALGVNVNYAPCCDVNSNPLNPVIGTRSFGEDPHLVADLAVAMIDGIQSAGVAATAKHFPGHGDTASDSHLGIPQVAHTLERLQQVEFVPFRAALRAGVRLVMSAHLALPAVDGRDDLPATLSPRILQGLLRQELGFEGVIVTDAMDMHAIRQGDALGGQAVQAAAAGADLLLLTANPDDQRRVFESLTQAAASGADLPPAGMAASQQRIAALKQWLAAAPAPDYSGRDATALIGCAAHRAVADEIAARSITLVRDHSGLLPLHPAATPRLALVLFQPQDLTPADTSSYERPALAQALRQYYPQVDEYMLPHAPQADDIAALLAQLGPNAGQAAYSAVIIGTLNAYAQSGQAEVVRAVLAVGLPCVVAALRMPYDLMAFPQAPCYVCTYSLLAPSMQALARVISGQAAAPGHLPVSIPGLYPRSSYEPAY